MKNRKNLAISLALVAAAICLTIAEPEITALARNTAPIAENFEFTTYKNVSLGSSLAALDADGDTLTYKVCTEPSKGTVTILENGSFVYTPNEGKTGRDYFGYKAVDAEGNESQEATVIIKIEKQKTEVTYSDMEGSADYYAAIALAENGIYVGEQLGDTWVFSPEEIVTRVEFLTMAMIACDVDTLSGVITTGFIDDADIPIWQKCYVATALMDGTVSGYVTETGAEFNPNVGISYLEASVILDNIMELTEVSYGYSEDIPTWASSACMNTTACGIGDNISYDTECLTRSEVANMLVSAIEVLENRD